MIDWFGREATKAAAQFAEDNAGLELDVQHERGRANSLAVSLNAVENKLRDLEAERVIQAQQRSAEIQARCTECQSRSLAKIIPTGSFFVGKGYLRAEDNNSGILRCIPCNLDYILDEEGFRPLRIKQPAREERERKNHTPTPQETFAPPFVP